MSNLTEKMDLGVEKMLDEAQKQGLEVTPQTRKIAEETIEKLMSGNEDVKHLLHLSPENIEKIYGFAYHLFNSGKYDKAILLFDFLRTVDPFDPRYSFALAASYQYKKNYDLAAANYIHASYLDPTNPVPYFHAYDCFVKQGYLSSALLQIEIAIEMAGNDSKYHNLKERAILESKNLKKMLSAKNNS